jgi:hypothetical protein
MPSSCPSNLGLLLDLDLLRLDRLVFHLLLATSVPRPPC